MLQFFDFGQHFIKQLWIRKSMRSVRLFPLTTRVDHPGMTQDILSKTEMGYKGTTDELVRAQGCTHGVY